MLAVGAGDNVVRLLPPLIVSEQEMAEGIARLDRACAQLSRSLKRPVAAPRPKQETAG
jgi:acetylornithine/N-succinyldiaminopimelate aminotransferase